MSLDFWFGFYLFIFSDSTYKRDPVVFVFLCLAYFTWHHALKLYPCCRKWQDFLFLVAGCSSVVYIHHIFIRSRADGRLRRFRVSAVVSNAALNVGRG